MMAARSQRRASKSRKKVTSMEVDFTGVEAGGRSITDGWAQGRIKKAEWTEAKESGNPMVAVQWEAKRGKEKATVFDNLVNTENALWRFKLMLEAVGIEVPDGSLDVDVEELVDLECDLLIANEDYQGKDQPRIVDYRPAGAGDIEEDEPKPKRRGKVTEDDGTDSDEDEDDEPPKSKRRSSKDEEDEEDEPLARKKRSRDVEEEEEEEEPPVKKKRTRDEEDEEEGEEEDRPARKGSKSKIKEGSVVKFKDEDDKLVKGVVKMIDGDDVEVETTKGDIYEVQISEIEQA